MHKVKDISKSSRPIIAPSMLSADFLRLGEQISEIEKNTNILHFDVMDGIFVPNISFGIPVLESLKKTTRLLFDVHLMIAQPERLFEQFISAGADIITVHIESTYHIHRVLEKIKLSGVKAGVAINPGTPVSSLEDAVRLSDVIVIMGVNPGFGGQRFIPSTVEKVRKVVETLNKVNPHCLIEVDGGVNHDNIGELFGSGADIFVAGAYLFTGEIKNNIEDLRKACGKEID